MQSLEFRLFVDPQKSRWPKVTVPANQSPSKRTQFDEPQHSVLSTSNHIEPKPATIAAKLGWFSGGSAEPSTQTGYITPMGA